MDDTEYEAVYQRLAEILDKSGLGWILSQVEEEIRTGKTREVEIETLKSRRITAPLFEDHLWEFTEGPRGTFPAPGEYSLAERLELLIDAIEQAIVNIAEMEHHIVTFFANRVDHWQGLEFFGDDESQSVAVSALSSSSRLEHARNLKRLINALRQEMKK